MPTYSQGSDRCRPTLGCLDFHDDADTELFGRCQHLCCCNTCLHIRPDSQWAHCCRCVPRLIFLRFTPSYPGEECCVSASVPMPYTGTHVDQGDDYPVSFYSGSLFGASVTVELGRFPDVAYSDTDNCYWHIVATKSGELDVDEYVEIDDDTVSCLTPPDIEIGEIEGPDGCIGTLSLAPYEVDHLPFVMREIENFSVEGDAYPSEFIDLYPGCGDCTQVCSVLCVYGHKTLGGVVEFAEFHWFDDDPGGPSTDLSRGWEYTDSTTDVLYTIWLYEDEYGDCTLRFDWEGSGILDDRTIDGDRGCSCGIKEVVTAKSGDQTIGFTIRCGYCTCWTFYCGTCRCVPRYLCVHTYIDDVYTPNQILTWDPDAFCWTGDGDVTVCLVSGDDGGCELQVTIGYKTLETTLSRNCGPEHQSASMATGGHTFDPNNDIISGAITEYDSDGEQLLWIGLSSLVDDCRMGYCTAASPCVDECGSHPTPLTVALHAWNEEPGYWLDCDLEVEVHYHEGYSWDGETLTPYCEYIGFAYVGLQDGTPKWVQVVIANGTITVTTWVGASHVGCHGRLHEEPFITEVCDPYFADTGEINVGVNDCCWGISTPITHFQITVSE